MATIGTTTVADSLSPPSSAAIAYQAYGSAQYLWTLIRTGTDTLQLYRSADNGTSWASQGAGAAFTHTGLQEWSGIAVGKDGNLHIAYRVGTSGGGGTDTIWYRRFSLSAFTWSSGYQTSSNDSNGGTIGSTWQGVDCVAYRDSNGVTLVVIAAARTITTVEYGIQVMGVIIQSGTIHATNVALLGSRKWVTAGTAPGRSGVSIELEHTGDGITSSTPHLWITWGRTSLRMVKLAWQGTDVGWQGPTNHQVLRSSTATAMDYACGRWDGTRFLMPIPSPDDTTAVRIYQRNQANSSTTTIDSPAHPQGVVRYVAVTYHPTSKNPRVFAVGTSTNVLYYVDYDRVSATWGSWATVVGTAVLGSGTEWGSRRGGSSGNGRHDVVTGASGSPNTYTHTSQSTTSQPLTPQFVTTGQAYTNGGPANVSNTLPLVWTFTDQDPTQTQGSYAVSRQIGAGALAYWRASDSTWQASEIQNSSATSALTLGGSWGAGSDANHSYKVKVWSAAGIASGYSDPLVLVPSVQVNPTITAPTAAQVLSTDAVTVSWTVAEQTGARLVLTQTTPGPSAVVYDSGPMIGYTTASFTIPLALPTATAYDLLLTTYNNEGLASTPTPRSFSVVYSAPPTPIPDLEAVPGEGIVIVTPDVPAPVGAQPAIASLDLYRRPVLGGTLNANPTMDGNITGWRYDGLGGSPGTLSFSSSQFIDPPGSLRYVPHAAGAAIPTVESSAAIDIVAGTIYEASAWMRPDTANKNLTVGLNFYNASDVFVETHSVTFLSPVATAWHFISMFFDSALVAATATKVRVFVGETGTPAAVDAFYADRIRLKVYNPDPGVPLVRGGAPTATYHDWGPASGVDYEWRYVSTGANGTSAPGPWTS